jgi:hypothetical protein
LNRAEPAVQSNGQREKKEKARSAQNRAFRSGAGLYDIGASAVRQSGIRPGGQSLLLRASPTAGCEANPRLVDEDHAFASSTNTSAWQAFGAHQQIRSLPRNSGSARSSVGYVKIQALYLAITSAREPSRPTTNGLPHFVDRPT